MNRVFVRGWGAVSPAGWGVSALRSALNRNLPLPPGSISCPGSNHPLVARAVPVPSPRPAFLAHPRLRRTSPIAQYAAAAALEALGSENGIPASLGLVLCVTSGCVRYSRRFYDETLKDPATASPLVFPETVFNAPASHLAALFGGNVLSYTLIGDQGTFLQALALAAEWLDTGHVENCLVVGAEEVDWLVAESLHLFSSQAVVGEGAGALHLSRLGGSGWVPEVAAITSPRLFTRNQSRGKAALRARAELNNETANHLLCDGLQGIARLDRDEQVAWRDWKGHRLSPKRVCGEAFTAAAAWQCVAAVDALATGDFCGADVSVVGSNQQAIAARFVKPGTHSS